MYSLHYAELNWNFPPIFFRMMSTEFFLPCFPGWKRGKEIERNSLSFFCVEKYSVRRMKIALRTSRIFVFWPSKRKILCCKVHQVRSTACWSSVLGEVCDFSWTLVQQISHCTSKHKHKHRISWKLGKGAWISGGFSLLTFSATWVQKMESLHHQWQTDSSMKAHPFQGFWIRTVNTRNTQLSLQGRIDGKMMRHQKQSTTAVKEEIILYAVVNVTLLGK